MKVTPCEIASELASSSPMDSVVRSERTDRPNDSLGVRSALTFDEGVLWAAARLVEWRGDDVTAADLIAASKADLALADEHDADFVKAIQVELDARRVVPT